MKIKNETMISIIALATLLTSCSKEAITGIIGSKPTASFTTQQVTSSINTYLSTSTTANAFNWQWQNESDPKVNGVDTFRTYYPEAGDYRVKLLALSNGGFDTTSQVIHVANDDSTVFIPGFDSSLLYLIDPDYNVLFVNKKIQWKVADNSLSTIKIDATNGFQTMDGFGFTLTGGSAQLMMKMNATTRTTLLQQLFSTDGNHIGISYLRLSIGASDLNDRVFTYDDLNSGETDVNLTKFNFSQDSTTVIPLLKEILAINPAIPIIASPWTAPIWMKDNNSTKAGSLKTEYYDTYANYFVKYIQSMKSQGITINAITPQNEPMNGDNNPSMVMTATQQAAFVKVLGAKFAATNINSKIIVWDHNADNPGYPISILNDPAAANFVDGSAFHLYAGNISALTSIHNQFPNKNLYFTEQWVGAPSNLKGDLGWHVENLIIGAPRNWSKNVLEWNLASDPNQNPHTDGGCSNCLGAITVDGNSYSMNTPYYIIAAASKFVRPGSIRITSNLIDGLPNVAFKTPDNKIVSIILNNTGNKKSFNLEYKGKTMQYALNSGAVATFVWKY